MKDRKDDMRLKSTDGRVESGRATPGRWSLIFVLLVAVALGVSGCGRKGPPKHPDGSDYPKSYPQE
ncbi:MAG: lipoprotein [Rhodospirillales bacterium]